MHLLKCTQSTQQHTVPSETGRFDRSHRASASLRALTSTSFTGSVLRPKLQAYAANSRSYAACDHQQLTPSWGLSSIPASRQRSTGSSRRKRLYIIARSTAGANGSRCPVLILPGFLSNNTNSERSQYRELADNLLALGHPAAGVHVHAVRLTPFKCGINISLVLQRSTVNMHICLQKCMS